MPGEIITEQFDKGLVTKRHPTMLREGELQQADDCVYRQFDPAIHVAPGRTEYNSIALGSPSMIKGLSYLSFDFNPDLLLAYIDNTLQVSNFSAITGTFSSLSGIGTLPTDASNVGIMNTVHFGDRHSILISSTAPRQVGYVRPISLIVANCTITGGINVATTVTKGFKATLVGQFVTGIGVPANTRIATKVNDTNITLDTISTNAPAITLTFLETAYLQSQIAGLQPITIGPTVSTAVGSWSTTSELGKGFYWFIYTEMINLGVLDDPATGFMESGFTGDMQVVNITDTSTQGVLVTRGSIVNSAANGNNDATHWQVYMSDRRTDNTNKPSLATFKRIGSPISITLSSFTFSDVNIFQGAKNPTIVSASAFGNDPFLNPNGALLAYDGSKATITPTLRGNKFSGFGFASTGAVNGGTLTGSEVVTGIIVQLFTPDGFSSSAVTLKTSAKQSETKTLAGSVTPNSFNINFSGVGIIGGFTDTWNETWQPSDFLDANFSMEVSARALGDSATIDGIRMFVFYTGTSVNRNGVSFKTVTYRSQVGTSVTDTVNLPPPNATTGDTFQGSLVLNDISKPSVIRYSQPGLVTSFPKPYFIQFSSRSKDLVTNIKRIGQVLVVGLRDSIQRVNYLPTENDTDFSQGIAHEDLASDHGIVGPHAATLFDMPDIGVLLAYISYKGIHVTDGITTRFLNLDLDWANTVDLTNLGTCILRNYSQENWLVLYHPPAGTSHGKNTRAIIFPYSPDKVKEGNLLPAIGPIKVSARCAAVGAISGKQFLFTGHQATGKIYVEDQGLSLPTSYTVANSAGTEAAISIVPIFKTRRIYPGGIGRQAREQRIYILTDSFGSTITANCATTIDSITVTSNNAFGNVNVGMIVTGSGIQPDTIVITKPDSSTITISLPSNATFTLLNPINPTVLSFSSGTLGLTISGQDTAEALSSLNTVYQSTEIGGLIVYHTDNLKESFDLKFHKVILPDTSTAALGVAMRLHYFAYMLTDAGQETHRS